MDHVTQFIQGIIVSWPTIMQYLGILSAGSFTVVAVGDFLVASLNTIAENTVATWDNAVATNVTKWWGAFKVIWENARALLDKFSIYSRPKLKGK
jgi:hypothetical protein